MNNWKLSERKYEDLSAQLIANRGLNPSELPQFLNPSLSQLEPPNRIHDMEKAAKRIAQAIIASERVAVFSDYDTDGLTSAATIYHALMFFGNEPTVYIPHRVEEGYGLNNEAIAKLCDDHTLIISTDCGITGVEPAKVAKARGVDLIVTDHHQRKEVLPDCHSIVHPGLLGPDGFLSPNLCGAGVAFKLAWAIGLAINGGGKVDSEFKHVLAELLAFSCLGTIADVVSLTGENRVMAHFGLKQLMKSKFVGIQEFIKSARLRDDVDGYTVGFLLAPRLNAAGRMGHAIDALNMLISYDKDEAAQIAEQLEKQNRDRQDTEKKIVIAAKIQAEEILTEFPYAIVVSDASYHPGVVGIVAARLVEKYYRPTIVLVEHGDECHGSCRSIEGFDLAAAIKSQEHLLIRWGGHAMAAGLHIKKVNLPSFVAGLNKYVETHCPPELLQKKLHIDAVLSLGDITEELCHRINRMGPFGQGNRKPVFAALDVVLEDPKTMGRDSKHLRYTAVQGKHRRGCVHWNMGDYAHKFPVGVRVDLAFEPQINEWQGRRTIQLVVNEIGPR